MGTTGVIDRFEGNYNFLSNFYPWEKQGSLWVKTDEIVIYLDDEPYPSTEHAYQAAKYAKGTLPRIYVQKSASPNMAKRLGRKYPARSDWDTHRLDVMEDIVRQKFTLHKHLAEKLLATGTMRLFEGNWWKDLFWGIDLNTRQGCNHLGRILMKIRNELRIAYGS